MLDVCLLGCGGSMPTPYRYLSSLLLSYKGHKVLIDCGEGTQVSMKLLGWGFKDIDVICLTHFHADHVIGLPGLLLTIGNSGRETPLTIIGPEGLSKVIDGLTVVSPYLPYSLDLVELPFDESYYEDKLFELGDLDIYALPLQHTSPCLGYSITVNRKNKFNKEKANQNNVPLKLWNTLQRGEDIKFEGKIYTPDMVLGESRKGIKISYLTDSRPVPSIIPFVKNSDLFICEGMYGEDDKLSKAEENNHMLFSEAAALSKDAEVKELWLTHFSPSLIEPENFLDNAKNIFKNTSIGEDRKTVTLKFED